MHLTPHERERLMIHVAADVAQRRRERGLRLNHPEAVALLTAHVLEEARAGRTVAEVMTSGRRVLRREELLDGVPEMITNVQVEATFPDGTKLVTLHTPVPEAAEEIVVHPGKVEHLEGEDAPISFNEGREVTVVEVHNPCDRPVQVGSHYHFAEANPGLEFDRDTAHGKRLNIPAGTAHRFEPNDRCEVELVPIEGERVVPGLRTEYGGPLDG